MRIRLRGAAATVTFLACFAIPGLALAGTLVVDNPTKTDAWITIQNSSKTSNIRAFRVAAGHAVDWVVPQESVYGPTDKVVYVRFQFMVGHNVVCDTIGSFIIPAHGARRAIGYYQTSPNHCHIKTQ